VSGHDSHDRAPLVRAFPAFAIAGMAAVCAHGVARESLWKSAEPRIMDIARDQYASGMFRSLTFAGMPFLEEPPLFFDVTAAAFHVGGGPSILAARIVVALFSALWVAAIVLVVRRAAGTHAGLLAGALLVVSQSFAMLVRRLGVDIALVATLSLSMALLWRAIATDDERIDGRWWRASLVAAGFAALTKGVFGTFLFVVPTLAYALLCRDGRVLRALFRPMSIALLVLPHALWALVLYDSGGATFVFEHFVNNTVGRVLHRRFDVAGTHSLPYGDVGPSYSWYYCLTTIPQGALPAMLAVPFAVAAQRARGGLRARDPESRLLSLALCWGCVPPIVLTFSTYKGRDHLGASCAALIVVGALWLARRLPDVGKPPAPKWALAGVMSLYATAAALVIAAFFGVPATRAGALVVVGVVGAVAVLGIAASLLARRTALAVWFLVSALSAVIVADFSPGANVKDERSNSMDAVAVWVAHEARDAPVGVYWPITYYKTDEIGAADEQTVGSLSYWIGRPVVALQTPEQVRSFLRGTGPAFFVVRRAQDDPPQTWPATDPSVGWTATGRNDDADFTLVANRAAAAIRAGPSETPPDVAPAKR
jgi:4-amino-4-deoxy-L-arabinose transferase-like glycosyltransferase